MSVLMLAFQSLIKDMTRDELREASDLIRERYDALTAVKTAKARLSLDKGDDVTWVGKAKRQMQGTVVKINRTTAIVSASNGQMWKVSLSLLKKV